MHRAHWDDADLIERALDRRARYAEPASCPACASRLLEWRALVEDVRSRAEPDADRASLGALAARVLAETTRRGPMRPEDRRFPERQRSARARAPRLATAAGVALLAGLGLLALDPRLESPSAGASGPVGEREAVSTAGRPRPGAGAEPAALLARARAELDVAAVGAGGAASQTAVGRILGSRGAWLQERRPIEPEAIAGASSDATARALWCEHVLDRYALEEVLPAHFDQGIRSMLAASTANAAERRLELAALARARDYGLLDPAEEGRLDEVLARAGLDPSADPLLRDGARDRAPIDADWLAALEDALGSAERCDPVVQAWLAMR
jgi:hypothetical protein